jgi:uncharacterized Zn finger protein (UPF0148 family)
MNNRFNLIGFNFPRASRIPADKYKHCVIHTGTRLISKPDEPGVLYCPICGTSPYQEKDTLTDEAMKAKHTKQQTKIVQAKKKKKYYDKQGNKINDETLLKDIARGANVISYNEVKSGEERHIVQK